MKMREKNSKRKYNGVSNNEKKIITISSYKIILHQNQENSKILPEFKIKQSLVK